MRSDARLTLLLAQDAPASLAALGCVAAPGHGVAAVGAPAEVEPCVVAAAEAVPSRPARVILCDDAPALRALLRAFLEGEPDLCVVGEAGDGECLADAVRAAAADAVLLDLSMPRVDGLEALVQLRAADPHVGIVVLSGLDAERMRDHVLALGADRYLPKDTSMREVRRVVRDVVAGRRTPVTGLAPVLP